MGKIHVSCCKASVSLALDRIRAVGTAAVDMVLVATGGADAYYHIGMHCWDIAASALIVTEAGGVVLDTDGSVLSLILLFLLLLFLPRFASTAMARFNVFFSSHRIVDVDCRCVFVCVKHIGF